MKPTPLPTVTIRAGTGVWNLTRHPWGGEFMRITTEKTCRVTKVIDSYKDGSPRKVAIDLGGLIAGGTVQRGQIEVVTAA